MRNIFLIKSKLQRRYLRIIELSLFVPTIFVIVCLYYLVFTLAAEQIAIPEFIAIILYPVVKKINIILMIGLPVIFALLFWWGLILSHRLAGPIDRLNKELTQIIKGDYKRRIEVRKEDELKSTVESINGLLDKIEESKTNTKP